MRSHTLAPRFLRKALCRRVLLCTCLLLLPYGVAAQVLKTSATDGHTPSGLAPGAPAGSYPLSGFENINPYNGSLNFHFPLVKVGGRGNVGFTNILAIEQKLRDQRGYPQRTAELFDGPSVVGQQAPHLASGLGGIRAGRCACHAAILWHVPSDVLLIYRAKMSSTAMRQPGTAGSASATSPRRHTVGFAGSAAR